MKNKFVLLPGMFVIALLAFAPWARATLGGGADSITTDRKALSAVHRATAKRSAYTVEEVVSDATTVREFVSSAGIVFAIAWNGNVHPDLSQLLGTYSAEYEAASKKTQRTQGRRHRRLTTGNIVVETWGHMRNLRGRAYVPGLVPAGVSLDEIK
jgi:hypothetical protein